MDLVKQVLNGVSDTRLLSDHHPGASPLQDLIKTYREKSAHNDNAPNLTDLSTGQDLKEGLEKLAVEDQVTMLYEYLCAAKRLVPKETPDQIEERQLKRTAVKAFIWVSGVVVIMLIGAVTTIGVRSGLAPSNELVGTYLEFAGEIAHLIWGGKE